MDTQIIATIVAGLLLAVAVLGTIIPVLPGSLLTVLTLLGWAWFIGGPVAWWAAGIGILLALVGLSASTILTGRSMKKQLIPRGSILFAVVLAIIGMFLIPVLGLFIGFAVGLLVGEYVRRKNLPEALKAAGLALKAMGLGMLVEFSCAALASSAWMIGVIIHFSTR